MATKQKDEKQTTPKEVQEEVVVASKEDPAKDKLDDVKLNIVRVGSEIKIKDGVQTFIGGQGVNSRLEYRKLYAIDIGKHGIVTVGYAPDAARIGELLPDEVEVVAPPKDCDVIPSKPSELIDVRIIGVEERKDNIERLKNLLAVPDDRVFIDEEHEGLHFNAQRAWRYPTDKKFVMVVQDDIDVCNECLKYCEMAVKAHPDDILSLFPFHYTSANDIHMVNRIYSLYSPYVTTPDTSGQAIIMSTDYVEDCMDSWTDEFVGDDVSITRWAIANNIKMITTLPSMIQHLGQRSVLDPSRSFGRTPFFQRDVSGFGWKNKSVTERSRLYKL